MDSALSFLMVRGANGAEAGAAAKPVAEAETEGTFASVIFLGSFNI